MPEIKRLTKSTVAALQPHPTKIRIVWDRDLRGLGVRIMPSGVRAYFLQRRTKHGRGIKLTLGRADRVTAEQARDRARELIAQVELGRDPARELQDARAAERARRGERTVEQLFQDWLAEDALKTKRPASVAGDRSLFNKHIKPEIGRAKVSAVTVDHARKLHAGIEAPYAANRCLALLTTLFNFAVAKGLRAENPCRGVKRNAEHQRERYLSPEEIGQLLAACDTRGDLAAKAVELLLATGARRSEVLGLRWRDVDLAAGVWSKPASGTKQKRAHRAPLNTIALRILASLDEGQPHERPFGKLEPWRLRKAWAELCRAAGIEGVRLHDLRHANASLLINAGTPIALVGGLLGHSSPQTTSRYQHLYDDPQRAAAAKVGDLLDALRKGGEPAEVVPIRPSA